MEFREFTRWRSDDMPETTDCVVVSSECGNIIKRLPHKKWNKKNNSYSNMKEYIYKQSTNRGKQTHESNDKKEKHGMYSHVEINGKLYSVHRIVAACFVENKLNLPCVNHKDGIRNNNHYTNLEWVTNKENVSHAWENGLRCTSNMMKIKEDDMPNIHELRKTGMSLKEIGKKYNVTAETIRVRLIKHENSNDCERGKIRK